MLKKPIGWYRIIPSKSIDLSQLISHREEVKDHLHEIYFLPDYPELKDIHAVLQDYKKVSADETMILIK